MIRVAIADDQLLVRSGFRIMLEQQPDLSVCGEAATGAEAVQLVRDTDPDIVLMDVRMPTLNGLDATRLVVRDSPRTKVLVLTTYDLDDYVVSALRAGASGYLLKDVHPAELIRCIRAVVDGETMLAQPVVQRLVDDYLEHSGDRADDPRFDRLSERERAILVELAHGRTNSEIASVLSISPATVKTHVANVLSKLELRDRVQAVILAYEGGFLRPTAKRRAADPATGRPDILTPDTN